MTSFIIVSTSSEKAEREIIQLCNTYKVKPIDQSLLRPLQKEDGKNATSLGIADVKRMQQKVSLRPIDSPNKAVILEQAELLTIPAQNSLLKLLEEPPERTIIILQTNNLDTLLPTIQSRCKIIVTEKSISELSLEEKNKIDEMLSELRKSPIGDRLKVAEQLAKDKTEAVNFIEQTIQRQRDELLKFAQTDQSTTTLRKNLSNCQQTLTEIKTTNANPRLLLESLFLSL